MEARGKQESILVQQGNGELEILNMKLSQGCRVVSATGVSTAYYYYFLVVIEHPVPVGEPFR